jgi:very-short-patch-repair endonuclease
MFLRMSQTPKKERMRLSKAAHDAVRGVRQSLEHQCKRATTREINQVAISEIEFRCADALRNRGFICVMQKAIGPYNIDIALTEPPIAVEIFGGQWHTADRHAARFRKRTDYLLDQGWLPVIVWVTRDIPFGAGAIEYIVALAEKMRRGESVGRKEQMIRGDGQPSTIGERKLNGLPPIPGPQPYDKTTGRFTKRPR